MKRISLSVKNKKRISLFAISLAILLFGYQNCAPQNFSIQKTSSPGSNSISGGPTTTTTTIGGPTTSTTFGTTTTTNVVTTTTTGSNGNCPSGFVPTGSSATAVPLPSTFTMPTFTKVAVPAEFITANPACLNRMDILQDTAPPAMDSISPLDYRTVGFHQYENIYSVYRISQSQSTMDPNTMYETNLLFAANVGSLGYFVQNKGHICVGSHVIADPAPNGNFIDSENISVGGPKGVLTLINRSGREQNKFAFAASYNRRNYIAGYSLSILNSTWFEKTIVVNGNIDVVHGGGDYDTPYSAQPVSGFLEMINGSIAQVNGYRGTLKTSAGNLGVINVTGTINVANGSIDQVNSGSGDFYLTGSDLKELSRYTGNVYVNNSTIHSVFMGRGTIYLSNGGRLPACIPNTWVVVRQ